MDKRQLEKTKYTLNSFNEYKDFIKDNSVLFIIKKTERIMYGVYMLSRFIPDDHELQSELKKTSNTALKQVSRFVHIHTRTQDTCDSVHATLQYLSSLLTLSFIEGFVSQSNIEIMKSELNYLHKHIEELSTPSHTQEEHLQLKSEQFVVHTSKKTVTKKQPSTPSMSFTGTPDKLMSFIKDKAKTESKPKPTPRPQVKRLSESGDDREQRIIDVIRQKGDVSIKDISTVIFDVSEKTIQRTLQALIDKGQIIKEGERRWARYKLS